MIKHAQSEMRAVISKRVRTQLNEAPASNLKVGPQTALMCKPLSRYKKEIKSSLSLSKWISQSQEPQTLVNTSYVPSTSNEEVSKIEYDVAVIDLIL